MWGSRWTAGFLLLVMIAPAFGPLAMAQCAQPQAMHCPRQPLSGRPVQPAMQCHHAMAATPPQPEESPASLQATDDCCANHHCCCGATTSQWARPASSLSSFISLANEPARSLQDTVLLSRDVFGQDSARAPPRSQTSFQTL